MNCLHCGGSTEHYYRCHYCSGPFCPDHRLPEPHDCDGVEFLSDTGKLFQSKFSGEVVESSEGVERPEPIEPRYTVGSSPDPEYESSPDMELPPEAKLDLDGSDEKPSIWERYKIVLGQVRRQLSEILVPYSFKK